MLLEPWTINIENHFLTHLYVIKYNVLAVYVLLNKTHLKILNYLKYLTNYKE